MSLHLQRRLGRDGPLVSSLGFGCMGLSSSYGKPDPDEQRFKVLDKALELGRTFWDTSDYYGDNEDLLGAWFKRTGKRSEVFLCTKFGFHPTPDGFAVRSDPEYIRQACERSLKRLGVDKIDLWYLHRVDKVTPIEKTIAAMAELKREGKIGFLGLSEVSPETLRRAHAVHPISAMQLEYSPFSLDIEDPKTPLLETCRELGVAIVAYSPLGRGLLTGQVRSIDDFEENDFRKNAPRFSKENFSKNLELADKLHVVATEKGCTSGQLALAWLMAQGDDIIPIPGTKKIKYLEENVGSLNVALTPEELIKLREEIKKVDIVGERYPPHFQHYVYGDTPPLEA